MGKYIVGLVAVLVIVGGAIFVGYISGVTAKSASICETIKDGKALENVCIVDGVTYVPEVQP